MMPDTARATSPKVLIIGALSGFLAAWLLAIELAAIQGSRALRLSWIIIAPWDPEIQPFTLAITFAAGFVSLVWHSREAGRLQPHRVSLRWYLRTVAWGLSCALLSIALVLVPDLLRSTVQAPASLKAAPLVFVSWGIYGLFFGSPIVLLLSPIVVWVAEQAVLRSRYRPR